MPAPSLAMVRSFAEHRAESIVERRTAIVEKSWILGPLFLFNNLHVAHHMRHTMPWYALPRWYRINRAALIERNGGLVYDGYRDVFRRYFLRPHDQSLHPHIRQRRGIRLALRHAKSTPLTDPARRSGNDARRSSPRSACMISPGRAEANDALWAALAHRLRDAGIEAPLALTRGGRSQSRSGETRV